MLIPAWRARGRCAKEPPAGRLRPVFGAAVTGLPYPALMTTTGREVVHTVVDGVTVEVRRSPKRRRTVSAYRQEGRLVVLVPARMSRAEEGEWVRTMVARVAASEQRRQRTDGDLAQRALALSREYLDGRAVPSSVRWVSNQRSRWGSCTPAEGSIRLSDKLRGMPSWVVDYVLLHELAHLLQPGHGPEFWALLRGYPRLERARGYLQGVSATAGLDLSDE